MRSLVFLITLAATSVATTAFAQEQEEPPPTSIRLNASLGGGTHLSYGFTIEGECWLSPRFGVGGRGGFRGDSALFEEEYMYGFLEPQGLVSLVRRRHVNFVLVGGVGLGYGDRASREGGLCLFSEDCQGTTSSEMTFTFTGSFGLRSIFYAGPIAISLGAHVEANVAGVAGMGDVGFGANW